MADARVIVLGIGNAERGDDGAGRAVAALLGGVLPQQVEIAEMDGEATAVLAKLDGADAAYLVDACVSGAPAGTVHRFDANESMLHQASSDISTHGFGLAAAIELGRSLGGLPRHTVVFAIEGKSFVIGTGLSEAVAAAAAKVAQTIRSEIERGFD